jgi:hypothetical protein
MSLNPKTPRMYTFVALTGKILSFGQQKPRRFDNDGVLNLFSGWNWLIHFQIPRLPDISGAFV